MRMLTRRLHVILDERRYRLLRAEARARRASVSKLVREAIDKAFPVSLERKRAAARAILGAEPMPLPRDLRKLGVELNEVRAGAKR